MKPDNSYPSANGADKRFPREKEHNHAELSLVRKNQHDFSSAHQWSFSLLLLNDTNTIQKGCQKYPQSNKVRVKQRSYQICSRSESRNIVYISTKIKKKNIFLRNTNKVGVLLAIGNSPCKKSNFCYRCIVASHCMPVDVHGGHPSGWKMHPRVSVSSSASFAVNFLKPCHKTVSI